MRLIQTKVSQEFNRLHDLHTANKMLANNREGLHALRRTISKHRLEDNVGIALLHKHFNLQSGEVSVGSLNGREIITTPMRGLKNGSIPWIWKSSVMGKWLPVQYIEEPAKKTSLASQAKKLSSSSAFWQEATRVIQQYHLADILGLALILNGAIGLTSPHILVERTNTDARHSISRDAEKQSNDIETFWAVDGDSLSPLGSCGHCKPTEPPRGTEHVPQG